MIASNPVQLIVIGVGLIGPRHAQHILQNVDCELLALIDPSPKAVELAGELNTLCFKSIDKLFEYLEANSMPYPDGAIICTPNHTHAVIAASLASKGVNLLIEKPVSTSLEEAKALQQFVKDQKVKVLIGHHRHVRTGGGALLINLIHDIDLLQYLFGPVERVYAELLKKQRKEYPNADEGACMTLRFKNGITGTFICADNVTSPFNFEVGTGENPLIPFDHQLEGFYKVFGSKGTLSIPDFTLYHQNNLDITERSWHSFVERRRLLKDTRETRKTKPFDTQLNHFIDVIRGKAQPACTISDGIRALLCVDAVLKSIESDLPQKVDDVEAIAPDYDAIGVNLPKGYASTT
ncbi:CIC11C00000003550 [Sungouiella intermedia]|uniref:CIC11C00000003550 n=1 Tax=Sungouiella intermedia TaxID=45354 RepID=A0A1L0BVW3_9ASCO|nr:CIC11C00000003550 [[Candida] intermedia]